MVTVLSFIHRRPGQASGASADPGPITTGSRCYTRCSTICLNNVRLWVPARASLGRDDGSYTGSAIEYFTWLNAKLLSIDAIPSSRVSFVFKNAS